MTGGDRPEDDITAAEYAFGFLESGDQAAIEAQIARDPAFAALIAKWEDVATELATDGGEAPRPSLWPEIVARLPGNDNIAVSSAPVPVGNVGRWQIATGLAAAAAVGLGAISLNQATMPPPVAPPPRIAAAAPATNPLVSVLRNPKDGSVIVVSFDASGKLTIAPSELDPGKGSAQLWVIPADGTPRSLGLITVGAPQWRAAPATALRALAPGATIAVTIEPAGGSPTGQPTTSPIMAGPLATI